MESWMGREVVRAGIDRRTIGGKIFANKSKTNDSSIIIIIPCCSRVRIYARVISVGGREGGWYLFEGRWKSVEEGQ